MSKIPKKEGNGVSIQKSSKHVTQGIISNFLFNYGTLPVNLIITYFLVRNITNSQGLLTIFTNAFVFTQGAQIWLLFLPPSIGMVLMVKVPEHILKGKQSLVKGIIRYAFVIKLIASTILAITYAGVGLYMIFVSGNPIQGLSFIIFSPYIILEEIRKIFFHLFQGMKKFMIRFYLFFTQKVLLLVGYLFIFHRSIYRKNKMFILH